MTGKDDPTISCSLLMVELRVLVGREIIPFGRRGLNLEQNIFSEKKLKFFAVSKCALLLS